MLIVNFWLVDNVELTTFFHPLYQTKVNC